MSLEGKVAIVTGGARGIGRAIAIGLAKSGAKVAFCHLHDPEADATLAQINDISAGLSMSADVSNERAVTGFFDEVQTKFGTVDILINNAGILHEAPLADTHASDFDKVISVNLRGSFLTAREFVRRTTKGRIINIASDLGILGRENMVAYAASKGAIISLTRTLALELAPDILVNAIAPGSTETDMTSPQSMSPEALAKDLDTPLARFARPEEIANMAVFLAGSKSCFITGQCLGVNGGSVMH